MSSAAAATRKHPPANPYSKQATATPDTNAPSSTSTTYAAPADAQAYTDYSRAYYAYQQQQQQQHYQQHYYQDQQQQQPPTYAGGYSTQQPQQDTAPPGAAPASRLGSGGYGHPGYPAAAAAERDTSGYPQHGDPQQPQPLANSHYYQAQTAAAPAISYPPPAEGAKTQQSRQQQQQPQGTYSHPPPRSAGVNVAVAASRAHSGPQPNAGAPYVQQQQQQQNYGAPPTGGAGAGGAYPPTSAYPQTAVGSQPQAQHQATAGGGHAAKGGSAVYGYPQMTAGPGYTHHQLQQQQQSQQHHHQQRGDVTSQSLLPPGTSSNSTPQTKQRQTPCKAETLTRSNNTRIDPAFVPRPLFNTDPEGQPGGRRFYTDQYSVPPPPTARYTVIDRGTSSCRFIRVALNQVPASKETLRSSAVPLAVVCTPFPLLGEYEPPVPIVNLNRGGPLVPPESETEGVPRCNRCRAYLNPFAAFPPSGGITCNFCGVHYPTPAHYEPLFQQFNQSRVWAQDGSYVEPASGEQASKERTEVLVGTVDFCAPASFAHAVAGSVTATVKKAEHASVLQRGILRVQEPGIVFVIDASVSAQIAKFTSAVLGAVRYTIESVQAPGVYVALVVFDQIIRFFPSVPAKDVDSAAAASGGTQQLRVEVVSDVDDPFFPSDPSCLFLDAFNDRQALLDLIDKLPALLQAEAAVASAHARKGRVATNAALRAAVSLLMADRRGTVKLLLADAPDCGCGSLKAASLAKDKEAALLPLYPPQDLVPFYNALVADCINNGVSVDVFASASANKHLSLSTLCYASRKTGGHVRYYPGFDCDRDYQALCCDVARQLALPTGFDCYFKLRCSRGFSVARVLTAASVGKTDAQIDAFADPSTFRLPRLDADSMLLFELQTEGDAPADATVAYLQYAVLHTRSDGVKMIRVVTLPIPLTTSITTTFKYAEVEVALAFFVRSAIHGLISGNQRWKDELKAAVVNILYGYRLNCASSTSSGQLILPDALKCLPVYLSGLLKTAALRSSSDVFADERDAALLTLLTAPLHQLCLMLYPTVFALHRSTSTMKGEKLDRIGLPVGDGTDDVFLPPAIPSSGERLTTDGVFLIDDGQQLLCYVGQEVLPEVKTELFGTTDLQTLPETLLLYEQFKGQLGDRFNRAIAQLRKWKGMDYRWQSLLLCRPRTFDETRMLQRLVEDKLGQEPSYVDFLCQLHKRVHTRMEES